MDEVEKQEPINLELFFLDKRDIEELTQQETFRNFIRHTRINTRTTRRNKKAI